MALRPGRTSQILQLAHRLEHGGHGEFARVVAKADVRAPAVVDIGVERASEIDALGIRKRVAVVRSSDLE